MRTRVRAETGCGCRRPRGKNLHELHQKKPSMSRSLRCCLCRSTDSTGSGLQSKVRVTAVDFIEAQCGLIQEGTMAETLGERGLLRDGTHRTRCTHTHTLAHTTRSRSGSVLSLKALLRWACTTCGQVFVQSRHTVSQNY